MPRVSVIVPMYNCEAYIGRCVESLVRQNYDDYDVLLVDDCSTDGTLDVANGLQASWPDLVRVIRRDKNGRGGGARNTGLDHEDGEWVAFVDSDDWVSPSYVQDLLNAAVCAQADMAVCGWTLVFPRGAQRVAQADDRLTDRVDKAVQMALIPSSACLKIYRRELFEDIRFLEGVAQEDFGVAASLVSKTTRLARESAPLYFYRQRAGSTEHTFGVPYKDNRIENLDNLSRHLTEYPEVVEFMHVRELLGYRTRNLLARGLDIDTTWAYVEGKYPGWRSNPLLGYLPSRLLRQIKTIDAGHLVRVKTEIQMRRLYARLRGL